MLNRKAIFAVDPGGSTGVAWGIVDMRSDTVVEAMSTRTHSGSATITVGRIERMTPKQFQKAVRDQVYAIQRLWEKFTSDALCEFDKHGDVEIEYVIEHFVLTGGAYHKPGVEGIFPAFMVGALIMVNPAEEIILQTAGKGMKWNTRAHLTRYDAWIVGREHERAAFAHKAARIHDQLR
jgi:hypothetical protein